MGCVCVDSLGTSNLFHACEMRWCEEPGASLPTLWSFHSLLWKRSIFNLIGKSWIDAPCLSTFHSYVKSADITFYLYFYRLPLNYHNWTIHLILSTLRTERCHQKRHPRPAQSCGSSPPITRCRQQNGEVDHFQR